MVALSACFNSRSSLTFRACNARGLGSTYPKSWQEKWKPYRLWMASPRARNSADRKGSSRGLRQRAPSWSGVFFLKGWFHIGFMTPVVACEGHLKSFMEAPLKHASWMNSEYYDPAFSAFPQEIPSGSSLVLFLP